MILRSSVRSFLWCSAGDLFAECPIAKDKPLTTVRQLRSCADIFMLCMAHLTSGYCHFRHNSVKYSTCSVLSQLWTAPATLFCGGWLLSRTCPSKPPPCMKLFPYICKHSPHCVASQSGRPCLKAARLHRLRLQARNLRCHCPTPQCCASLQHMHATATKFSAEQCR